MCVCSLSPGNGDLSEDVLHHQGELGDCSKLSTIISDFERAVFEAVYHVYPSTGQSGCWFHFNSAVWKNIGEKGLQSLFFYQNPSYQEVF